MEESLRRLVECFKGHRGPAEVEHREPSLNSFMINIVIECPEASTPPTPSVNLTELWVFDPLESEPGRCFPLMQIVSGRWEVWGRVDLPCGMEEVECILKSDQGDLGFCRLAHPLDNGNYTHLPFSKRGSSEETSFLRVSHTQRSEVNPKGSLNLWLSWRVGQLSFTGNSIADMAHSLAWSALPVLARFLDEKHSKRTKERKTHEPPDLLRFGTVVQMMDQAQDNIGIMLSVLYLLEHGSFEHTCDLVDLSRSISAAKRVICSFPEDSMHIRPFLDALATAHCIRWDKVGDLDNLDTAVAILRKVIQVTPVGNEMLSDRLLRLGSTLVLRFRQTKDITDISDTISAWERALETSAADGRFQAQLGGVYHLRYQMCKDPSDLDRALSLAGLAANNTPQPDGEVWKLLFMIGCDFNHRSNLTTSDEDINKSITALQRALRLMPAGSKSTPIAVRMLTEALEDRFSRGGDPLDMEEAIETVQRAMEALHEEEPSLPLLFSLLGSFFEDRVKYDEDPSNISASVALCRKAVAIAPGNDPGLTSSTSFALGSSLLTSCKLGGGSLHLEESIVWLRKASDSGGGNISPHLVQLGFALVLQFMEGGDLTVLDEAMSVIQKAMDIPPYRSCNVASAIWPLAALFLARFDRTKEPSDISEAISCTQRAQQAMPDDDRHRGRRLGVHSILGDLFTLKSRVSGSGEDACAAIHHLKAAATSRMLDPQTRFNAARRWGHLSSVHSHNPSDSMDALDTALDVVVLVDSLGQATRGYFTRLQQASDLPAEAAAFACWAHRLDKALEWLEKGRCLVWRKLGHLRTPFDSLREHNATLAESLQDVAKQLQLSGPHQSSSLLKFTMIDEPSVEYRALTHARLTHQWDSLLDEVRLIPSFETFLRPLACSELLKGLPGEGPVIIINVHKYRCDAIALMHGLEETMHTPLPKFSWEKAGQYSAELRKELEGHGLRRRGDGERVQDEKPERKIGHFMPGEAKKGSTQEVPSVRSILGRLWMEVVKPILEMLAISKGDRSSRQKLPRIWWCLTGPLSFLPIHAAGIYTDVDSECLLDYAVSSYTPTVTMLIHKVSEELPVEKATSGLFLTNQPNSPGASPIPGTTNEVRAIFYKATMHQLRVKKAEGSSLSPKECLEYMKNFSSIHLACHASQHPEDPLKSQFKFHLGNLELATIMQADLRHADLAFLSACQTSAGHDTLSEEAFHLAAGMLAAGYRRVVATMWSIGDRTAPQVANDFYDFLWTRGDRACRGGAFDGSMSAHALHHAIQKLRGDLGNSEDDLLAWIPYVHFGY